MELPLERSLLASYRWPFRGRSETEDSSKPPLKYRKIEPAGGQYLLGFFLLL